QKRPAGRVVVELTSLGLGEARHVAARRLDVEAFPVRCEVGVLVLDGYLGMLLEEQVGHSLSPFDTGPGAPVGQADAALDGPGSVDGLTGVRAGRVLADGGAARAGGEQRGASTGRDHCGEPARTWGGSHEVSSLS